jgi:diacylglycerol kinase (ATP)
MAEYNARQVAVVANPFSGAKRNPQRVAALIAELERAGLEPVAMWGRDDLSAAAASPDFTERFRCVIAAGGDGTLHRVINTTRAAPIAHFPLGTENLFARHFAHSADPQAMAAMVAAGRMATLDLGQVDYAAAGGESHVTSRLFAIVASAGFDAQVIHRLDRWRCQRPNRLRRVRRVSYIRPILAAALGYRFPVMDVEADGRHHRGALCMVFNLPKYGLDFRICPDAAADDGLLDYIVFERSGAAALMRYALSVKLGRHLRRPDVHSGRARTIRITSPQIPLEVDGEEAAFAPIELRAIPAAMRILIP